MVDDQEQNRRKHEQIVDEQMRIHEDYCQTRDAM